MARELHDTLAHSLSAVAVQLEAVDSALTTAPDEARTILGKALAQTRSGLTETRRAMQELRASPLDDLGLALAIQNLALITAQRAGVVATVELPERAPNLSPAVEQGVYRIAQEALTNAARHAGATQLKVTLACNGAVALTIADNGRGFDTETVAGDHMGVQLMRERAAMLGGILEIASAPGAGTTVRLVIG
jgi:two-component system NarL family sensor kinase